jgi:hypothetical protein
LRDVGRDEKIYDPISYHQGSVWPLFTGWASVAEYRTGRPLSGYAHLMQNADLTWQQDLGAVTELLSGDYFAPFGRSTTHQMWSSAMVMTPAVRGLFGISRDGAALVVDPHLPADWDGATLHHLSVDGQLVDLAMKREGGSLVVKMIGSSRQISLSGKGGLKASGGGDGSAELRIPLPGVEVGIQAALPLPGASTAQMKVLGESYEGRSLTLQLEAMGGSTYDLLMRLNGSFAPRVDGAVAAAASGAHGLPTLHVLFPAGEGYQRATVRVTW